MYSLGCLMPVQQLVIQSLTRDKCLHAIFVGNTFLHTRYIHLNHFQEDPVRQGSISDVLQRLPSTSPGFTADPC